MPAAPATDDRPAPEANVGLPPTPALPALSADSPETPALGEDASPAQETQPAAHGNSSNQIRRFNRASLAAAHYFGTFVIVSQPSKTSSEAMMSTVAASQLDLHKAMRVGLVGLS
jgi:hypothetical protein